MRRSPLTPLDKGGINCAIIFIIVVTMASGLWSPAGATLYAGEFLEIGVGGRPLGMGGAWCALADDPSSFYWNPAGLAHVPAITVWGMYANQFGKFGDPLAQHSVVGAAIPITGSVLAVHWIHFAVDQIPLFPDYSDSSFDYRKNQINGIPEGYFGDSEDALFISLAHNFKFNLDLGWSFFELPVEIPAGLNLKMIRQKLYHSESSGIGGDAGFQVRWSLLDMFGKPFIGSVSVGLMLQDFTDTQLTWSAQTKDVIPMNWRFGVGYHQPLPRWKSELNFERVSNTRYPNDGRMGLEYIYDKKVALRFGFTRLDWGHFITFKWKDVDFSAWTAGAGIHYKHFTADYAFLKVEFGNVHRLSVNYEF
jgi:hypothetical protein